MTLSQIIPCVFAGHIDVVWWLRPAWAKQIDDGDHQFMVGGVEPESCELAEEDEELEAAAVEVEAAAAAAAPVPAPPTPTPAQGGYRGPHSLQLQLERARLRVSSEARYYVDDPWCVAPPSRMTVKAPLRLLVSTVAGDGGAMNADGQGNGGGGGGGESARDRSFVQAVADANGGWILDICLGMHHQPTIAPPPTTFASLSHRWSPPWCTAPICCPQITSGRTTPSPAWSDRIQLA